MSLEGVSQENTVALYPAEEAELDELNDWIMNRVIDSKPVEGDAEYVEKRARCTELMDRRLNTIA